MPNFFQLIFGKYTNNVAENEIKDTNKAQDIHSKYKKLQVIEEQLKLKRDFEGLLNIHHEFLNLINATGEHVDRLPQIAYCLARLGRKDESMESLKKLAEFSYMIDRDEIYRATVLVTCFTDNQKADLNLMQYNTIKSWLQHPDYSKQVVEIVFDYSDFISDTKPFNAERLKSKQINFSNELINSVFTAMQRDNSMNMYYNKELNEIHLEDGGYFLNLMAENKDSEMKKYQNKILKSYPRETIIKNIHYLIPRLQLIKFFEVLAEKSNDYNKLKIYVLQLMAMANAETDINSRLRKDTLFDLEIMQFFHQHFIEWGNKNEIHSKGISSLFDSVRRQIALDFLQEVNQ